MIINRIYENQNSSVKVACFLPGRTKDLPAPLYVMLNFACPKLIISQSTVHIHCSLWNPWAGVVLYIMLNYFL